MSDGGPAFPHPSDMRDDGYVIMWAEYGMSLRDYFAAKALQGMLAADGHHAARWTSEHSCCLGQPGGGKWMDPRGVAKQAFEIADAMLKEREHATTLDATRARDGTQPEAGGHQAAREARQADGPA